jgi:uncharacterized protein YaeQ
MALTATIHTFEISLNDSDRGVYEALEFRVARHPSETAEYLIARVLAYCLEYCEGLTFSKGLSDPDQPALAVRDLTGVLRTWIEIGTPEPARLHKASKTGARVAVYSHKDVSPLLGRLAAEPVHRQDAIEILTFDPRLIGALVASLDRRMRFDLTVSERHLYLTLGEKSLDGALTSQRA